MDDRRSDSLSGGGTHHKGRTTREHGMQHHITAESVGLAVIVVRLFLIDQALAPAVLVAAVSKGLSLHRS